MAEKQTDIVICKPKGKVPMLEMRLTKDTVWLNAYQIASLFGVNRPAIVKHITNIYKTGELKKRSTFSILEQVVITGKYLMS
jgi:hypothetical protein